MKYKGIILLLVCCCIGAAAQNKSQQILLEKHVKYLASDELGGRLPGTEGEDLAGEYIKNELKKSGCELLGEDGLQKFRVELKTNSDMPVFLEGENVVAKIPGKTEQYIVIGAHYDHLGMGGYKSGSRMPDTTAIHNGADDNASGVAAMLECARVLAQQTTASDCGFIFVAFSGEERGLVGSKYFVDHLPVPQNAIKAMFNFDMVGRLDTLLTIHGTETAVEFTSLLDELENKQPFSIQRNPGGFGPSDHTSFYAEKIPILYFHTSIHEDYHTPFDDWELINFEGMKSITDFALDIVRELSKTSQLVSYQESGVPQPSSRGGMKVTLGIMPDHVSNIEGLKISAVRPGLAADMGGLQKEDIIVGIQGEKVTDIESYMNEMNKFNKGDIIIVDIIRKGEKIVYTIYL